MTFLTRLGPLVALVSMIGPGAARAGVILLPGDIVVLNVALSIGSPQSVLRVDPATGAQAQIGQVHDATDLEVDELGRVYVLDDTGDEIVRIQPQSFDAMHPTNNQEVVWTIPSAAHQCGGQGFGRSNDGTLLIACSFGNEVLRVDPALYDASNPGSNQAPVAQGGLVDAAHGVLDVAIDPVLGSAYVTTFTDLVEIEPAAFDPSDPSANQLELKPLGTCCHYIAIDFERRLVLASQIAIGRITPSDPMNSDPLVNTTMLPMHAEDGSSVVPGGIAVERTGNYVVTDGALINNISKIVRIFPATFDPKTDSVSVQTVSDAGLLDHPVSLAIMSAPEPAVALSQLVAFGVIALLTRRRAA